MWYIKTAILIRGVWPEGCSSQRTVIGRFVLPAILDMARTVSAHISQSNDGCYVASTPGDTYLVKIVNGFQEMPTRIKFFGVAGDGDTTKGLNTTSYNVIGVLSSPGTDIHYETNNPALLWDRLAGNVISLWYSPIFHYALNFMSKHRGLEFYTGQNGDDSRSENWMHTVNPIGHIRLNFGRVMMRQKTSGQLLQYSCCPIPGQVPTFLQNYPLFEITSIFPIGRGENEPVQNILVDEDGVHQPTPVASSRYHNSSSGQNGFVFSSNQADWLQPYSPSNPGENVADSHSDWKVDEPALSYL